MRSNTTTHSPNPPTQKPHASSGPSVSEGPGTPALEPSVEEKPSKVKDTREEASQKLLEKADSQSRRSSTLPNQTPSPRYAKTKGYPRFQPTSSKKPSLPSTAQSPSTAAQAPSTQTMGTDYDNWNGGRKPDADATGAWMCKKYGIDPARTSTVQLAMRCLSDMAVYNSEDKKGQMQLYATVAGLAKGGKLQAIVKESEDPKVTRAAITAVAAGGDPKQISGLLKHPQFKNLDAKSQKALLMASIRKGPEVTSILQSKEFSTLTPQQKKSAAYLAMVSNGFTTSQSKVGEPGYNKAIFARIRSLGSDLKDVTQKLAVLNGLMKHGKSSPSVSKEVAALIQNKPYLINSLSPTEQQNVVTLMMLANRDCKGEPATQQAIGKALQAVKKDNPSFFQRAVEGTLADLGAPSATRQLIQNGVKETAKQYASVLISKFGSKALKGVGGPLLAVLGEIAFKPKGASASDVAKNASMALLELGLSSMFYASSGLAFAGVIAVEALDARARGYNNDKLLEGSKKFLKQHQLDS